MNDETNQNVGEEGTPALDAGRDSDAATGPRPKRHLPEPIERSGFAVQERVLWPLQDRLSVHADRLPPVEGGRKRALLGGGALAVLVAGVAVAIAISSGGGNSSSSTSTVAATPPPQRQPLVDTTSQQPPPAPEEKPAPTLHGAAPVFSPPSPASKGGEKTGSATAAKNGASDQAAPSTSSGSTSSTADSSPAGATISSDPERSSGSAEAEADGAEANSGAAAGANATAADARATVPDGPPAGPAALKVAREFAHGFVVYETGGEKSDFKPAFEASATPELTKALLQRPPRQPAGVKVPKAKVLNVVAGPSQGTVYKVSVSLLRVGVTSELRLDMEKLKNAEWRVTNVLG